MPFTHHLRVHPSADHLEREDQLAWKLAELATDRSGAAAEPTPEVLDMVVNRVIDNAAVAAASLTRPPVVAARTQALAHPYVPGAAVFGSSLATRVSPEWAAWANGVAVRELDFHDTFLAAEYSHPGDNVPPILAVAQHAGADGAAFVRGVVTGYEVQVDLVRAISLHAHKIDHVAHLGPSAAAGIGTLLGLPTETVFQAIGQALHTTTATRQSRKGQISTWKAYAPAFAGKMAIEAVDRAMRGQTSPEPIYEGEDGIVAWLLDGPDASYDVVLPGPGEARTAILDTYTKEHSAEYQAQALIDLARSLHHDMPWLADPGAIERVVIHTSHHTHFVIGSGANDPQKYDPTASRETLDHSVPYIFTVALQDGGWHHVDSYTPARAARPDTVALWQRVTTAEDPEWTRRYHATDPAEKAFGARVEIELGAAAAGRGDRTGGQPGNRVVRELAVADAHPLGARPFARADYVRKLRTLADGVVEPEEIERFLDLAERLPSLSAGELRELSLVAAPGVLRAGAGTPEPTGLFELGRPTVPEGE